MKHALDRIDRPFDFTLNENIQFQYAESPKTDKDRIERWRLQLKYALIIERSQGNRHKDQIEFLKSRYESIRKQVQDQTQQQKVTNIRKRFPQLEITHAFEPLIDLIH